MPPQARSLGQQPPATHDSPIAQHVLPQGACEKPQHRLCEGMHVSSSSQHEVPHASSGVQQLPALRQISPSGQQRFTQAGWLGRQHRLLSARQVSSGSQQVLPQISSGSQQMPALGPVSMQTWVEEQHSSPTQAVLPGLQQIPIDEFRQVSSEAQQATSPHATGQHGAPVALQPPTQTA